MKSINKLIKRLEQMRDKQFSIEVKELDIQLTQIHNKIIDYLEIVPFLLETNSDELTDELNTTINKYKLLVKLITLTKEQCAIKEEYNKLAVYDDDRQIPLSIKEKRKQYYQANKEKIKAESLARYYTNKQSK